MAGILESDLNQLKILLTLYEAQGGQFKTEGFFLETKKHLYEEIDYTHEAENIKTFKNIFMPYNHIHVPEVIDSLSTDRLLTMSWMHGDPLESQTEKPHDVRKKLTKNLFWSWYYPLYSKGYLHGDPHSGNFCS